MCIITFCFYIIFVLVLQKLIDLINFSSKVCSCAINCKHALVFIFNSCFLFLQRMKHENRR